MATDCSGLDTPVLALKAMKIEIEHIFSSDITKYVQRHLRANVGKGAKIFADLLARDNAKVEGADLYIAGFPCQPFSSSNHTRKGLTDPRGTVFGGCAKYIAHHRPMAFILENVRGLMNINKGKDFQFVLDTLRAIGDRPGTYNIHYKVLNTRDYGIAHNRPRLYIVSIRNDATHNNFTFPKNNHAPACTVYSTRTPLLAPTTSQP